MKRGAIVWLFVPKRGDSSTRILARGQYIWQRDGFYIISSRNKLYKRKRSELAEVTETEKSLLTTLSK